MRKFLVIISLLILLSSSAFAQVDSARTLSVVGFASAQITPDMIVWKLTINARHKNQAMLRDYVDEVLTQVMIAVDSLGIDHNYIEYDRVSISMRYEQNRSGTSEKVAYYEFNQPVIILQKDISEYEMYWDKLTAIKGVTVTQQFKTSQLEETKRQLRIDALVSAKQKALDLSGVLGGTVNKAITVSEFQPGRTLRQIEYESEALFTEVSFSKPKKIEVTARIYVVFQLE